MSYAIFKDGDSEGYQNKREGKTSGGSHLVDGEWITTSMVAEKAKCSISLTRKYIVNGVMSAKAFIQMKTK